MTPSELLTEVIDYFASHPTIDPGSDWAHSEDGTSYCLDHSSGNTKLWIDLEKDGTITLLWRRGTAKPTVMKFVAAGQSAPAKEGE